MMKTTQTQTQEETTHFDRVSDLGSNAVTEISTELRGRVATGTVHHVAWRVANDESQKSWRQHLVDHDLDVTPVLDRCYFRSIYFREPGGVLFELATDPPGFAIDEPIETLGETLKLPPWLEQHRGQIEHTLPAIQLHSRKQVQDARSAS